MSARAYTEDQFVEQPAIGLFKESGWATMSALEAISGTTGTLLREAASQKGVVRMSYSLHTWVNGAGW